LAQTSVVKSRPSVPHGANLLACINSVVCWPDVYYIRQFKVA